MFSENILFSIFNNKKQKKVFDYETCFLYFLLWRIEKCYKKQFPNRPLIFTLKIKNKYIKII